MSPSAFREFKHSARHNSSVNATSRSAKTGTRGGEAIPANTGRPNFLVFGKSDFRTWTKPINAKPKMIPRKMFLPTWVGINVVTS
jgi:hypothetical protein